MKSKREIDICNNYLHSKEFDNKLEEFKKVLYKNKKNKKIDNQLKIDL